MGQARMKIYRIRHGENLGEIPVNRDNLWYWTVEGSVRAGFKQAGLPEPEYIMFEELDYMDFTYVWVAMQKRTFEENLDLTKYKYAVLTEYFRMQEQANSPDAPDKMRIKFNLI